MWYKKEPNFDLVIMKGIEMMRMEFCILNCPPN
jgi:hypothetical protein